MAAQRKPAPKRGATKRKPATTATPKKKVKWWMWLLIPAILIAFIYALLKLSDMTPAPAAVKQPAPVAPKEPVKPKPAPAKAKPETTKKKEDFEFYKILQDSEVDTSHVDAYKSTPRGEQDFYYMVQAASFRNPEDADRLRAELILSGMDTKINTTMGENNKPWHRVVVGPFESRSSMNRAIDKLAAKGMEAFAYKVKKDK